MGRTRIFNGKSFQRHSWFKTKAEAESGANWIRANGNKARVIKGTDPVTKRKGYFIYVRKGRKREINQELKREAAMKWY